MTAAGTGVYGAWSTGNLHTFSMKMSDKAAHGVADGSKLVKTLGKSRRIACSNKRSAVASSAVEIVHGYKRPRVQPGGLTLCARGGGQDGGRRGSQRAGGRLGQGLAAAGL